jgi:hypothetical protein
MLGIKDKYTSFCIDETACYVYAMLQKKPEENNGNKLLAKIASKKRK